MDVLIRRVDVGPAATQAVDWSAHRSDCDVVGQNQQIGPAEVVAVSLLDRSHQAGAWFRLPISGQLLSGANRWLPVFVPPRPSTVRWGADAMPGHADEQRAEMAVIGWPPVLTVGHQHVQIRLDRVQIKRLERFGIVEIVRHRAGVAAMLVHTPTFSASGHQSRLVRLGLYVKGHFRCRLLRTFLGWFDAAAARLRRCLDAIQTKHEASKRKGQITVPSIVIIYSHDPHLPPTDVFQRAGRASPFWPCGCDCIRLATRTIRADPRHGGGVRSATGRAARAMWS